VSSDNSNNVNAEFRGDLSITEVAATPLPATWTTMIAGLLGFGFFAWRGMTKRNVEIAAA
jgi:hypothetical protein